MSFWTNSITFDLDIYKWTAHKRNVIRTTFGGFSETIIISMISQRMNIKRNIGYEHKCVHTWRPLWVRVSIVKGVFRQEVRNMVSGLGLGLASLTHTHCLER